MKKKQSTLLPNNRFFVRGFCDAGAFTSVFVGPAICNGHSDGELRSIGWSDQSYGVGCGCDASVSSRGPFYGAFSACSTGPHPTKGALGGPPSGSRLWLTLGSGVLHARSLDPRLKPVSTKARGFGMMACKTGGRSLTESQRLSQRRQKPRSLALLGKTDCTITSTAPLAQTAPLPSFRAFLLQHSRAVECARPTVRYVACFRHTTRSL